MYLFKPFFTQTANHQSQKSYAELVADYDENKPENWSELTPVNDNSSRIHVRFKNPYLSLFYKEQFTLTITAFEKKGEWKSEIETKPTFLILFIIALLLGVMVMIRFVLSGFKEPLFLGVAVALVVNAGIVYSIIKNSIARIQKDLEDLLHSHSR